MNVDTNGGVFGDSGVAGLGSVLPPNISEEGFEDLGGPGADSGPYMPPVQMPGPMPAPGGPVPSRRAPMPRPMPGYPVMGLGQGAAVPAPVYSCSKTGPTLVGFFAGALTVGLGCGVFYYFSRKR